MSSIREVVEGLQEVGIDEVPIFTIDTEPWGGSPSSPSVEAFSQNRATGAYTDVTSTVFPSGSPSVNGDVITLPQFNPTAECALIRVEVQFTSSGSVFEAYFKVDVTK